MARQEQVSRKKLSQRHRRRDEPEPESVLSRASDYPPGAVPLVDEITQVLDECEVLDLT